MSHPSDCSQSLLGFHTRMVMCTTSSTTHLPHSYLIFVPYLGRAMVYVNDVYRLYIGSTRQRIYKKLEPPDHRAPRAIRTLRAPRAPELRLLAEPPGVGTVVGSSECSQCSQSPQSKNWFPVASLNHSRTQYTLEFRRPLVSCLQDDIGKAHSQ